MWFVVFMLAAGIGGVDMVGGVVGLVRSHGVCWEFRG